ncbi:hypothetical protein K466DRAFT_500376, partial [Polyporus arcularius HHB13444]
SALRNTLRLTQGVTDLTLFLPNNTPPDIFLLVHLHNLRLFKTNLSHRTIAQFLGRHKSLTHLVLGACGRVDECPLAALDLRHITSLECDASCVGAIAHGNLTHLTIDNRSPARYMSSILRDLAAPASSLYSLTIDFFADDTDILQSIALASPMLKKLKLIEHPSRRRASTRRAFNDHLSWHRGLRKLAFLEELSLRTSAPLVRRSGELAAERRLIMGWATGIRTDRKKALRQGHPRLYHVRIWYGATVQSRALTKWFRDGQTWLRLGPPVTGAHLEDIDF